MPISAYVFIECTAGAARDVAKEASKIQGVQDQSIPGDARGTTGNEKPQR